MNGFIPIPNWIFEAVFFVPPGLCGGILSVSVSYLYLRYFAKISILLYLSDTGVMYLEYLTEDTFQSIFPNPEIK